jgi:outer membrane lipoprotein LolB
LHIRSIFPVLVVLAISACSVPGSRTTDPAVQQQWGEHRLALAEVRQWDIYARAVLRLEGEAYNIGIRWQRELDSRFMMLLEAPFGQGVFRIENAATGVYRLSLPDGQFYEDSTVEALMQQAIGWSLPIGGLDYWIRGLPQPDDERAPLLDARGRAQTISQAGWEIDYLAYFPASDVPALPRRLRLENEAVMLKLAIERWQPAAADNDDADLFPSFD